MNDPGGGGTSLSEALASLSQEMEGILTKAKALYKECDLDDFVDSKVGVLWGLMTLYVKCFESANVLTRPELEDQIKKHFRSHEVQDNFENLLEIEGEWDGMLQDIDKRLTKQHSDHQLVVGDPGPINISLIDARTGTSTSLGDHLDGQSSLVLVLMRHFA